MINFETVALVKNTNRQLQYLVKVKTERGDLCSNEVEIVAALIDAEYRKEMIKDRK